jgi:hypothetical protein
VAKCFLSYSYGYRNVMSAIRGILKALDFESVEVIDGPDDQRPTKDVVEKKIRESDCLLLLCGPENKPTPEQKAFPAAHWPNEEALFAHGMNKPITLIVHPGTEIPEFLKDMQSPARFDFWEAGSFLENVHHVVKHLSDFKRRVELPPGHHPYRYSKVEARIRMDRLGKMVYHDWYHEVSVAAQRDVFHHALTTGSDEFAQAVMNCIENNDYEIQAGVGAEWHTVSLQPGKCDQEEFEYLVKINPPLRPGEVFGYRRTFALPNQYPTTKMGIKKALERKEKNNGKIPLYIFDDRFYGEPLDVVYDADRIIFAFHFPKRIKIKGYCVDVREQYTWKRNEEETARCNGNEYLKYIEEPESWENILELVVPRPIFNHHYFLLYEIAE